ncbi:MAG: hypothetical protein ACOVNU_08105 [Candidatus Kapaibacteriota bacterium]
MIEETVPKLIVSAFNFRVEYGFTVIPSPDNPIVASGSFVALDLKIIYLK